MPTEQSSWIYIRDELGENMNRRGFLLEVYLKHTSVRLAVSEDFVSLIPDR